MWEKDTTSKDKETNPFLGHRFDHDTPIEETVRQLRTLLSSVRITPSLRCKRYTMLYKRVTCAISE